VLKLRQAIVVEGRYDRIRLASVVDATIVETGGFRIFKDPDKLRMLRTLAEVSGLIILTDSDRAGFCIRRYIQGAVDPSRITHVYIPSITGRERRKSASSAEGTLGVEGLSADILLEAFAKAGVQSTPVPGRSRPITRADLMEDGLAGGAGSAGRRRALMGSLGLPGGLSTGSLLTVLNTMMDYEEYKRRAAAIEI
jgi:ribonuclease M5